MREFLVVGGRQSEGAFRKEEWHKYKKGLVLKVNALTGEVEVCLEYQSPPEVCAYEEDPSIIFKAATLVEDKLYLCTQTEILVYRIPNFDRLHYLSLPFFNDLHHVRPHGNESLLVAVTGLDMVAEITFDGDVIHEWGVLGQDPWERFSRNQDYRRVVTTKPHHSHPNFVFFLDDDIWVTRFEQRDAVSLTSSNDSISIDIQKPHDGIVYGRSIYFTTVDGHIVIVEAESRAISHVVDLNAISDGKYALGWCRGIHVLDEARCVVGFGRLRPTRFRENVRWVKHGLGLRSTVGNRPTRIVCYDLTEERELWEIDLEPLGMNAIFSIHESRTGHSRHGR